MLENSRTPSGEKPSLMTEVGTGDPYSEEEAAVNNTTATEEPKARANGAVKGLNNRE